MCSNYMWRVVTIFMLVAPSAFAIGENKVADEIHWTIMGATSVSFQWRGSETTIRYGLSLPYTKVQTSVAADPKPRSSTGPFQQVMLTDLKPDRLYHYSIGSGPDHTFRTPPSHGASGFVVMAEGDVGSTIHYPDVALVQGLIASHLPRLVLVLGDLTYGHPEGQEDIDRHFNDVMSWSQDAAYMPIWGNHEWSTSKNDDLTNYKGRFQLPNDQPSVGAPELGCCGEDWYWFDYGNVRFISYPEPYSPSTWAEWYGAARKLMHAAESDRALKFIVTFGHRPTFSSGYHESDMRLRPLILKLAKEHRKYVLNLNGHSHNYERSRPFHGVTSITVGTGGSMNEESKTPCLFRECPQPSWSAFRALHLGVLRLRFSSDRIEGTFLCAPAGKSTTDVDCNSGATLDRFIINGND